MWRFFVASLFLLLPSTTLAQWPPEGLSICNATSVQSEVSIVPDGAGGVIMAWRDLRPGPTSDIYAQRVNASGFRLWLVNGVAVCSDPGEQTEPRLVSDTAGGVVIAWTDQRAPGMFAQRLNADGVPQWAANGVPLAVSPATGKFPEVASDGQGGIVAAWLDYRNPGVANVDIYAQRLNSNGARQWDPAGVPVCTQTGTQIFHVAVTDGHGGIIVAWHDERIPNAYPYAQRIDGAGATRWMQDGVRLTSALTSVWDVQMTPDGAGGAIACWAAGGVFAQRIDGNGALKWGADAVSVRHGAMGETDAVLTTDGAGGAIIAWVDLRNTGDTYPDDTHPQDVYAQRVSATGQLLWPEESVEIVKAPWKQEGIQLLLLDNGASMIAWRDDRDGFLVTRPYAQLLGPDGVRRWDKNGRRLTSSSFRQLPACMARDLSGGVIITLYDQHGTTADWDIYATRDAVASVPPGPVLPVLSNRPNPFSQNTSIQLGLKSDSDVVIDIFDAAGRRVRRLSPGHLAAGPREVAFDGLDANGHTLPNGVYFCRVQMSGGTATRKLVITR